MSAAFRLPSIGAAVAVAAAVASVSSSSSFQAFVSRTLGTSTASHVLKVLAAAYLLANFKNLPGVWHLRVLRGIIYQIYFNRNPLTQPKHLFRPVITESRNTIMDCDYNIHKSNSTYFADLDVARAHALSAVIRTGLDRLNKGDEQGINKATVNAKGKYMVALGAVSCFFQRQIDPLAPFEIYTRVLSWDRKWIYLISHIDKKGAIKPDSYLLQPWKKVKRRSAEATKDSEDLTKYIYATSVSRYVFKKGRLTINPELVLERSRLLPPRPEGVDIPPRAEAEPDFIQQSSATNAEETGGSATSTSAHGDGAALGESDEWTWDDMEAERLRGLKLAVHLDAMQGCHEALRAGDVLGKYSDYW